MANRTFAVGDIHGDLEALLRVIGKLPTLDDKDTLIFLGDYMDRGMQSAQVIDFLRKRLPTQTKARVVTLRGNHEDGWLRVIEGGWPEFVGPEGNGCLACMRSFIGKSYAPGDHPDEEDMKAMLSGSFFPPDVVTWMKNLPYWYEDEHAIYVHAGLPFHEGQFLHPSKVEHKAVLLWVRTMQFFLDYRGKLIVVGHTSTDNLPPELSSFTPEDPLDMWVGENVIVTDTGCGKGGFLTCLELPARRTYESR
jgi:serine/threonine protein phosphatase 1